MALLTLNLRLEAHDILRLEGKNSDALRSPVDSRFEAIRELPLEAPRSPTWTPLVEHRFDLGEVAGGPEHPLDPLESLLAKELGAESRFSVFSGS